MIIKQIKMALFDNLVDQKHHLRFVHAKSLSQNPLKYPFLFSKIKSKVNNILKLIIIKFYLLFNAFNLIRKKNKMYKVLSFFW